MSNLVSENVNMIFKSPKGEIVLLVEGACVEKQNLVLAGKEDFIKEIGEALGHKKASHLLSDLTGQSRKDIYQILIGKKDD